MKFLIAISFFVSTVSCGSNRQENKKDEIEPTISIKSGKKVECDSFSKVTSLVQQIIDIPALQQYYKIQNTISQNNFIILKNDIINSNMILKKFNKEVNILSLDEIKNSNYKAYLNVEKMDIKNDTAKIYLEYSIQGLGCEAEFLYQSTKDNICKWKLLKTKLFEY